MHNLSHCLGHEQSAVGQRTVSAAAVGAAAYAAKRMILGCLKLVVWAGSMRPPLPGGDRPSQPVKVGKLNLVDLAGSERVHVTGATGQQSCCYHLNVPEQGAHAVCKVQTFACPPCGMSSA